MPFTQYKKNQLTFISSVLMLMQLTFWDNMHIVSSALHIDVTICLAQYLFS